MTPFKKIILCADDFGLNSGICEGILKLTHLNRLSAVSCMVNTVHFTTYAKELVGLINKVQVGLHINLTEGFFVSERERQCFNLKELLFKTHLHLVSASFIKRELNTQLQQFIQVMGRWPDFIDGHQHVHQFPIIRKILLKLYEQFHQGFIRSTYPMLSFSPYQLKCKILIHTGGKKLKEALTQVGINHNNCFAGVYDFSPDTDYRSLFCQWLQRAPTDTLIMCHPGEGQQEIDPIASAREVEMAYFASSQFMEDCAFYKVQL